MNQHTLGMFCLMTNSLWMIYALLLNKFVTFLTGSGYQSSIYGSNLSFIVWQTGCELLCVWFNHVTLKDCQAVSSIVLPLLTWNWILLPGRKWVTLQCMYMYVWPDSINNRKLVHYVFIWVTALLILSSCEQQVNDTLILSPIIQFNYFVVQQQAVSSDLHIFMDVSWLSPCN
jgi:hypothetical protein